MNEPTYLLDASALIALMLAEAGAEKVEAILPQAVINTVNLSEVVAKLQERGVPEEVIVSSLTDLGIPVVAFDRDQAIRAGLMRTATRRMGLSLGDRACLATAATLGVVAITADQSWQRLEVGVGVEAIR